MAAKRTGPPLVSVVIPTYNSGQTIERCLKSIKKQTYRKIEVIIVDEFSQDETQMIAKKYAQVFSLRGERSKARNFGIKRARGEYVLIIDADMELSPKVVQESVNLIQSRKFDVIVIPEISLGQGFWADCRKLERRCYYGDDVIEAARFFPKKLILGLGGYDHRLVGAEDWDLHQKIRKKKYKIGRIKSKIIHHEGKVGLIKSIRKKMYYGVAFNKFKQRYPHSWRRAVIRTAFLRHWQSFVKDPIHGLGVIIMKLSEGIGLFLGMILAQKKSKVAHY